MSRRVALTGALIAAGVAAIGLLPAAASATPTVSVRIVGGNPATGPQYAHVVAVSTPLGSCGGALITPRHVLTAGHCLTDKPGSVVATHRVAIGWDPSQGDPAWIADAAALTIHPQYNPDDVEHDIAIITLDRALTQIPQALVPDSDTLSQPGKPVTIAGWGLTSYSGEGPDRLLTATLEMFPDKACTGSGTHTLTAANGRQVTFRGFAHYGITVEPGSTICAGGLTTTGDVADTCQGDSGGPLTAYANGRAVIVGIVSWGIGCAGQYSQGTLDQPTPGAYTPVHRYSQWVNANTQNSAPTLTGTRSGNGSVTTTWTVETADTPQTLTVTATHARSATRTCTVSVPRGATNGTCTLDGLTPGRSYQVRAVSDLTGSSPSAPQQIRPSGPPSAPKITRVKSNRTATILSVQAGNGWGGPTMTQVTCTSSARIALIDYNSERGTATARLGRGTWSCQAQTTNEYGTTRSIARTVTVR